MEAICPFQSCHPLQSWRGIATVMIGMIAISNLDLVLFSAPVVRLAEKLGLDHTLNRQGRRKKQEES